MLSSDANIALVPAVLASGGGRVFVFHRTGTTWTRVQTLADRAPGDFGIRAALSANAATALVGGPGFEYVVGAVVAFQRQAAVVPALTLHWTLAKHWLQAQITPRPGASHYTMFATSPGAAPRTAACTAVETGLGRRVRCSTSLSAVTWTVTAQAESTTGVIAQTVHRATVS